MALKGYFLDNETYSANDVNTAFSFLTTEGVSLFSDTANITGDINEAISSLTSEGVDIYNTDSCMVFKSGDVYMVKKGVCFLPDGAFVVVDNDGYALDIKDGLVNYVYAMHDHLKNECKIYTTVDSVPENAVILAQVSEKGKITDRRIFSMSKVAVPTTNITTKKTIEMTFPAGETKNKYTYTDFTVDLGYGGYNYIYTNFDDLNKYVYIADGKKRHLLNYFEESVSVKKEGNNLLITLGTWSLNHGNKITVELSLL